MDKPGGFITYIHILQNLSVRKGYDLPMDLCYDGNYDDNDDCKLPEKF